MDAPETAWSSSKSVVDVFTRQRKDVSALSDGFVQQDFSIHFDASLTEIRRDRTENHVYCRFNRGTRRTKHDHEADDSLTGDRGPRPSAAYAGPPNGSLVRVSLASLLLWFPTERPLWSLYWFC